ncbi:hypothetical protein FE782_28475 [Paenibacillus antri]|uniref:Uncharacterized protein n=1 Tax=Paenibacillus antri TaxID=2582848 RepID=A0A5R9FZ58_9BACL|nr:hypothetical protein [Paenibacillus antri]TLS48801.1 hypothetical protein FE782_28475 [Paenibacillus antri]
MKYLFVHRGGDVPKDQANQNVHDLWRWLDDLKAKGYEAVRFAGTGRKSVSMSAVDAYSDDIFGVSIIEADSLEEAI